MAEKLASWGELCERAGIRPGVTDPASPVEKLISAGFIASSSIETGEALGCAGGGCGAGSCCAGDF